MSQKQVVTRPGGTVKFARDATANDSDKTFTVPTGKVWEIIYIEATFTASATVGNRYLGCDIGNGTDKVLSGATTPAVAAAAKAGLYYTNNGSYIGNTLQKTMLDSAVATTSNVRDNIPQGMMLPAGYTVRVWDEAAIDAAADDLVVVIHYIEYEA